MSDPVIDTFISDLVGTRLVKWYKRKKTAEYPATEINVEVTVSSPTYAANPYVRVADQSELWEYKGEIAVLIRPVSGLSLVMAQVGEIMAGDYRGTSSSGYDIETDDRIVDSAGKEFKVMSISTNFDINIHRLSLKYLPE